MTLRRALIAALLLTAPLTLSAAAQNPPCPFDEVRLQFRGTPKEQALCLLRPNRIDGVLEGPLKRLPAPLSDLIGRRTAVSRASLLRFLEKTFINPQEIGGDLNSPLSHGTAADGSKIPALYFVIHDTSHPLFTDSAFPSGFDTDPLWRGNDLSIWKQPVAHVFVNRLGQSVTTSPFSGPVGKGFGTKFARDTLKAENSGLKLHIELVQPRRRDPAHPNPNNDRFAPTPGFTDAQYERLALLYLTASVRRGSWLIPGYHSAYDAGIKNAHDDPQNFELQKFAGALERLIKALR